MSWGFNMPRGFAVREYGLGYSTCLAFRCAFNGFRSVQETASPEQMKRPHMDSFLATVYEHYDLAIWSQTSWRWLELKLTELGFLNNPNFR